MEFSRRSMRIAFALWVPVAAAIVAAWWWLGSPIGLPASPLEAG